MTEVKKKHEIWWKKKIRDLEAKIIELEAQVISEVELEDQAKNKAYAQAYYDCMSKYGILSKLQRRRLKERIELYGESAINKSRSRAFSVQVPT